MLICYGSRTGDGVALIATSSDRPVVECYAHRMKSQAGKRQICSVQGYRRCRYIIPRRPCCRSQPIDTPWLHHPATSRLPLAADARTVGEDHPPANDVVQHDNPALPGFPGGDELERSLAAVEVCEESPFSRRPVPPPRQTREWMDSP